MGENSAEKITSQLVVCPNCLEENEPYQHFCKNCGAPLSPISTVGPLERTLSDGFMYRQAVSGRRKLIVVIGIWIMFLPTFIFSLYLLVLFLISYFDGLLEQIGLAIGTLILGLVSFTILFRTTKNHLIARRKDLEERHGDKETG